MTRKQYITAYVISLVFFLGISIFQKTPGYMDASYYYASGMQIASGRGLVEPFIWNYFSDPQTIPTPAFTYWMPLASLISALSMALFQTTIYWVARLPFIFLAAGIPVLTIYFASRFSKNKLLILSSGLLGLFAGYYLPYLTLVETFTPYFILGAIALILFYKTFTEGQINWQLNAAALGLVCGLIYLSRADGILWLFGIILFSCLLFIIKKNSRRKIAKAFFLILIGYMIVLIPWLIRNISVFGAVEPRGTMLSLWLTNYNDLFLYPVNQLNFSHLLSSGINQIIQTRFQAALLNIWSLVGTTGEIILLPFMIMGVWKYRRNLLVQISLLITLLIFLTMSFVFPFAGMRGGFFHSMSSLQCFYWGISIAGFEIVIKKVSAWRHWRIEKATKMFWPTILAVLAIMSLTIFSNRVFGLLGGQNITWEDQAKEFLAVNKVLISEGASEDQRVMVNDAPSFYAATDREAIQLTTSTLEGSIAAMGKFKVRYLILDSNSPSIYSTLYKDHQNTPDLQFITESNQYAIYELAK